MVLEYLRRDDVLKALQELDLVAEEKDRYRMLGRGIYVNLVPIKKGTIGFVVDRLAGDRQAVLNPDIDEIVVDGDKNLRDYPVEGGRRYADEYLDSMGLYVKGPRGRPHICASISGEIGPSRLKEEVSRQAERIIFAQYKLSKFPEAMKLSFDRAAREHFGL